MAKTESLSNPIPRSFLVKSLSDFAAGLQEELLLCPVRALRIYLFEDFFGSSTPPSSREGQVIQGLGAHLGGSVLATAPLVS